MTLVETQNQKIISLLESILAELKAGNRIAKNGTDQVVKESKVKTRIGKKLLAENMTDQLVRKIIGG
jgi:hypothetical protein